MSASSSIRPMVVEPSRVWEGNDGPWSTFSIRVGNPAQDVNVLVSTTVPETWVVMQDGCNSGDPSYCARSRGGLFNINASSTWIDENVYELGAELNLGYDDNWDNGDYGFDTLGSNDVALNHQVIGAIATKDFYLGNLGLTPRPINFTTMDDPRPSFLSSLKSNSIIPSLSYGYTAGANYRLDKGLASLTLGGYDASRFIPNSMSFDFAADISRDLVVGLQAIDFNAANTTSQALLPGGGILTFVDSTVPHIWLPLDSCRAFEEVFGITWDSTTALYLLNNTQHDVLTAQNASVSFILGNYVSGGETVNLTLPYSSFDRLASYPIFNESTRYFPLKRAANDTQYTLGRTFLQETFLIVDYEKSNFSISQSLFLENSQPNIIAIPPINATIGNSTSPTITKTTPSPDPDAKSHSLDTGAMAGIIITAVLLMVLTASAAIIFAIRRRRRRRQEDATEDIEPIKEVEVFQKAEMDGSSKDQDILEMYQEVEEKDSREVITFVAELEGSNGSVGPANKRVFELDGGPIRAHELPDSNYEFKELPTPPSEVHAQDGRWSFAGTPTSGFNGML